MNKYTVINGENFTDKQMDALEYVAMSDGGLWTDRDRSLLQSREAQFRSLIRRGVLVMNLDYDTGRVAVQFARREMEDAVAQFNQHKNEAEEMDEITFDALPDDDAPETFDYAPVAYDALSNFNRAFDMYNELYNNGKYHALKAAYQRAGRSEHAAIECALEVCDAAYYMAGVEIPKYKTAFRSVMEAVLNHGGSSPIGQAICEFLRPFTKLYQEIPF